VKWAFIPAGEVMLEVLPLETINGVKSYHFMMSAKTYPYIDPFYKVRDRIDAYSDVDMTHSILYKKKQKGRRMREVVVNFNWERHEAQYSNFEEIRKPISILPGAFDPLSIFYAFRLHALKENNELETPVTDGKKCVTAKAKVLRKERIKLGIGSYDTYLVEPDLQHIGGVFKKSKNARLQIWVTSDERRIPVRIKSKVVVGSFVAELISVEAARLHEKNPLLNNAVLPSIPERGPREAGRSPICARVPVWVNEGERVTEHLYSNFPW
jgi:hypothetical protein